MSEETEAGLSSEQFVQQQPVRPQSALTRLQSPSDKLGRVPHSPRLSVKLRHDPKSLFTPGWKV